MHPSTLSTLQIDGPVGLIDVALNDPGSGRRGIALIAHPHPLQGGTRDNKVVTTLARAFFSLHYCAARPNFRGVGASAGVYDQGIGETDDLVAVVEQLRQRLNDAMRRSDDWPARLDHAVEHASSFHPSVGAGLER